MAARGRVSVNRFETTIIASHHPPMRTARTFRSRPLALLLIAMLLVATLLAAIAWRDTMREPMVRRTSMELPGLEPGEGPVRIALISDIHVAGPDLPPERLSRIVAQINALSPDVVMIAGDMIGDRHITTRRYTPEEAIAPLSGLEARLGVFVAPGNHDHWTNLPALTAAMARHGVTLLVNDAVEAGPLVIGGLDDAHTYNEDWPATLRAMEGLQGGRVIISHSPDAFPEMPGRIGLMVAGHTHCGQLGFPWGGAPVTMSRYGQRYACGRVDEGGKVLVTSAGLGNSGIPMRLFVPPDIWLIEARPPAL